MNQQHQNAMQHQEAKFREDVERIERQQLSESWKIIFIIVSIDSVFFFKLDCVRIHGFVRKLRNLNEMV